MAYRKFHKAMSLLERVLCFVRHGADPGVYSTAEGWRCKRCHALLMKNRRGAIINTNCTFKTVSVAQVFDESAKKEPTP